MTWQEEFERLERKMADLKTDVAKVEADLATIKTGIASLNAQIQALQAQLAAGASGTTLSAADQAAVDQLASDADALAAQFPVPTPPAA